MRAYSFEALDHTGRNQRGLIGADSLDDARRRLRERRLYVVEIGEEGDLASQSRSLWSRRLTATEVAAATRQLASLLRAGMPLVPALGALVEQSSREMSRVMGEVRERVNGGVALANALAEHPRVFTGMYVAMVRAGESAGALDVVLTRLAEMMEKRARLTSRVRAALAYPLFMIAIGGCAVLFLLSYVIPSISKLFLEMHRQLPWPTLLLMQTSAFVSTWFWLLALAALAAVVAARKWITTPGGRSAWDRWSLTFPLTGDLTRKLAVSRFARTLGMMLASGVPILEAFEIVKHVTGNAIFAVAIDEVKAALTRGDGLASAIRRTGVFPPIVCHMMAIGESSGNIEEGLANVAEAYDNEVEIAVTTLTALLEPLLILVMGGMVGFMVVAILLPIFDMNQAIH